MPARSAKQVIEMHAPRLLAIEGVVGVYEGTAKDGATILKVAVSQRIDSLIRAIPEVLEGYPVEIQVSGEVAPHEEG